MRTKKTRLSVPARLEILQTSFTASWQFWLVVVADGLAYWLHRQRVFQFSVSFYTDSLARVKLSLRRIAATLAGFA